MQVDDNKILEWAINYHRGELTVDEQRDFELWLNNDPEHINIVNKYRRLYTNSRGLAFQNQVREERAWSNISKQITPKKKARLLPDWAYYAAAILVVGLLGTWFIFNEVSKVEPVHHYNFEQLAEVGSKKASLTMANGMMVELQNDGEQLLDEKDGTQILKDSDNNLSYKSDPVNKSNKLIYNEVYVPRAGEYSLTLSDGTQVWLNSDTQLRYPVQFGSDKREVYLLKGEACFQVAHNKEAPFSVYANDTKVKALGTMFNVSSYENQPFISTTLVEGSVKVDYLNEATILKPNQQSIINKGQDGITVNQVDASVHIAWIHGVFEFENADLKYLTEQLGRWYNVSFFFTEPDIKNLRFTGAFKRDQSINYAISLIERITNVKFKVEGETIIIEQ